MTTGRNFLISHLMTARSRKWPRRRRRRQCCALRTFLAGWSWSMPAPLLSWCSLTRVRRTPVCSPWREPRCLRAWSPPSEGSVPVGCCTRPTGKYNIWIKIILSHCGRWIPPDLSESPFLIFKVHADFIWVFSDRSLEHLRHCEVHHLVDVYEDQELEVPPGSPRIPARRVVEQVERVVSTGEEVGEGEEAQQHVGGDQVWGPGQAGEEGEADPGEHSWLLLCYNMNPLSVDCWSGCCTASRLDRTESKVVAGSSQSSPPCCPTVILPTTGITVERWGPPSSHTLHSVNLKQTSR